jgi:exodeoxyribonuclease V alpha subunit
MEKVKTSEDILNLLLEKNCITGRDRSFALNLARLTDDFRPAVLALASLVAAEVEKGHICINIKSLQDSGIKVSPAELVSGNAVGRPGDNKPLIIDESNNLYLHRLWKYEYDLARNILKRAEHKTVFSKEEVKKWLSLLFPEESSGTVNWQKLAVLASAVSLFCVISGGPGTGKTTIAAKAIALILEINKQRKMNIFLAAPTGKAASRIKQAVLNAKEGLPVSQKTKSLFPQNSFTIHRLLLYLERPDKPKPDVVIIDEASMVDLVLLSRLLSALPERTGVILLGDKDQLASVEAGAVLGDICAGTEEYSCTDNFLKLCKEVAGYTITEKKKPDHIRLRDRIIQLVTNYRFSNNSGIYQLSLAVNRNEKNRVLEILKSSCTDITWLERKEVKREQAVLEKLVVKHYSRYILSPDIKKALQELNFFRVLCAVKEGPFGTKNMNLWIENILDKNGLLNPYSLWYRGRPILIHKNKPNLNLFNGDIGLLWPDADNPGSVKAYFLSQEGDIKAFSPSVLPEHETAFAMTIHKSQGSEFDSVVLALPEIQSGILTKELLYTGITRARCHTVIWGSVKIVSLCVSNMIERHSGLKKYLWQ